MKRPFPCSLCKKWKSDECFLAVSFNGLHGNKKCPDCGRVSNRVVVTVANDGSYKRTNIGCLDCNPIMKHCQERICIDCYYDGNLSLKLNQKDQNKQTFFKMILPTAIISLFVGFFLGWLFFKKLQKKRKMK